MELRDFPGQKGLNPDIIDQIIENRIKREHNRRNVCKTCHIMTSTDGTCYCGWNRNKPG